MLKVKKKIHKNVVNKNQEDDLTKIQSELKNSIKNVYINDQKKKKTIDEYAQLTIKIREEYVKLQQENNQLKIELQKYKNYIEQMPQPRKKYYSKPIRKRKHYSGLEHETESDESDSYVEVRRRPKQQKKRIVYEDELDGIHEYEPQSPSEDEEPKENYRNNRKKHEKENIVTKKTKKGITKSIKM